MEIILFKEGKNRVCSWLVMNSLHFAWKLPTHFYTITIFPGVSPLGRGSALEVLTEWGRGLMPEQDWEQT